MSGERPSDEIMSKIETVLNAILCDDLAHIDGQRYGRDAEDIARKLERKIDRALSEVEAGFFVSVKLNPARITV
jgi:hypothetical protein